MAARTRQLEAELVPAGIEGAALAVDTLFVIKKPSSHVIQHEKAFKQATIGALARYSVAVLAEALRELNDSPEEWVPVAGVMVQLCEKQVAWRRDEQRDIVKQQKEHARRRAVEQAAADRQRAAEEYLAQLAARLGGDITPADVAAAQELLPAPRRPGQRLPCAWSQCVCEPWARQLVRQLALIAQQPPADRETAIAQACDAAGLDPPPAPRAPRQRPIERDAPRPLGEISATLDIGAIDAPPSLGGEGAC